MEDAAGHGDGASEQPSTPVPAPLRVWGLSHPLGLVPGLLSPPGQ